MNLLLTNDDGYDSEGLRILAEKLSEKHNVYIIAPHVNRSAVSHCIKMFNTQEIRQVGERIWTCSGFPADCVIVGVRSSLLDVKFDAVFSGINRGLNIGSDIIYSGTCAAARQAALYKIPGIALSIGHKSWDEAEKKGFAFETMADFVLKNVEKFVEILNKSDFKYFLNVNALSVDSYKGVKTATSLCKHQYSDSLKLTDKDDYIQCDFVPGQGNTLCEDNGDYKIIQEGYVSVSTVYAEPVCGDFDCIDCNDFSL